MLTDKLKEDLNNFLHSYYYKNYPFRDCWDKDNDIQGSLINGTKRIVIDYEAMQKFDEDNDTNLCSTLSKDDVNKVLVFFKEGINFDGNQDKDDPRVPLTRLEFIPEEGGAKLEKNPLEIGFKNIPTKINVEDTVNRKHFGRLVEVGGIIKDIGVPVNYIKKTRMVCCNCGNSIPKSYNIFDDFKDNLFCMRCKKPTKHESSEQDEVKEIGQVVLIAEDNVSPTQTISIKTVLREDLIDSLKPDERKFMIGANIKICGLLLERGVKNTPIKKPILEALYWKLEEKDMTVTDKDIERIKEFATKDNALSCLISLVSPSIYGNEVAKEALLLQMVGGVKYTSVKDKKFRRGSIHVLLVGDPGTAKTNLIKFVCNHIKKAKYTSCSEVTHAGLGATVTKDKETECWVIEGGVLPLAHRSIAGLDEIDKADKDDIKSLDVVMEIQQVPVDKAGIHSILPAETSILAGANPKFSRFDPYIPIKEQVLLPETTLSRFDIKIPFRDIPNQDTDDKICDRISGIETENISEDDVNFLIKYITYCRSLTPRLNNQTTKKLKDFYITLRNNSNYDKGVVSITPRQFESLIRFTQAYAKLRLADETTEGDAEKAINLFKKYLREFGFDEKTGFLDIDKAEGRTSSGSRNVRIKIMEILARLHDSGLKLVPHEDFVNACKEEGIDKIDLLISDLKNEGIIFEPKPHFYQKV